jgi:hypothetical protein
VSIEVVRKLIALAADKRGNINERQNAAVKACEMMKAEGLVVHDPDPWDIRDRHHFPKDPRVDCTCPRNSDARGPEHAVTCAKFQREPVDYGSSFRVPREKIDPSEYRNDFRNAGSNPFGSAFSDIWAEMFWQAAGVSPDQVKRAQKAADNGQSEAQRRREQAVREEDARRQALWEDHFRANDPKAQAQRAYARGFDAIDWSKR